MRLYLRSMILLAPLTCGGAVGSVTGNDATGNDSLHLNLRFRTVSPSGQVVTRHREEVWQSDKTAVIVCDMWDAHHCYNATQRVGQLAVRMNEVLNEARDRGALIVHAPSSCMSFYADHPGRLRAHNAPQADNLPGHIGNWCHWKDAAEQQVGYPIDHTDGGEDDEPRQHSKWVAELNAMGRNPGSPWIRQIETLEIDDRVDVISDSGVEIWNVIENRGIENVILLGVHTNMCVLGRPFGLRQMARHGKNVVLMRDMTDTMYNPARPPYVSHFRGTELVVQHIEKMVCPTITSDQILGGKPFRFPGDQRPHVVVAISEALYDTKVTLAEYAREVWQNKHGYRVSVLIGDTQQHSIPGLADAMRGADALVLSIRRQALPPEDLEAIKNHLRAGKPLLAIRTSSHAFDARGNGPRGHVEWPEFDHDVLGGNYSGHHAQGPLTHVVRASDDGHAILRGVAGNFTSSGSLYKASPLTASTTMLLLGSISGQPEEPVAWTSHYGPNRAKVFYTSLGHKHDFEEPQFVMLLDNAMRWAVDQPIPLTLESLKANWHPVCVPRSWRRVLSSDALSEYDGYAWYQCQVKVPAEWKGNDLTLNVGRVDDRDETYFNGVKVGGTGHMPRGETSGNSNNQRRYLVSATHVQPGQWNTVAVRVFDQAGDGGIVDGELGLSNGKTAINLAGTWLLRVGDNPDWARAIANLPSQVGRFQ